MNAIEITVPYSKKHLITEIKNNGGKFNSESKTWTLDDNPQNRSLKEMIERRLTGPSQTERLKNVLTLSIDLLNALKHRKYYLIEAGDRIII